MKYLTLHQTEADYGNLVLDSSNTPHVAFVVESKRIAFTKKINGDINDIPEGYEPLMLNNEELLDADGKQVYVKIN